MRYTLFALLFLTFFSPFATAQITEFNPAIGWNYVKSQELELVDEVWYNTDFAAESGYDYIFIMNHKLDSAKASLQVFDMQDSYVAAHNNDTSRQMHDLPFDVKESGMYRVFFLLNDNKGAATQHTVQMMLIRRKKI